MELSKAFGIDPNSDQIRSHNKAVREVMAAYKAGKPMRVPLLCGEWYGQHGFHAQEIGLDYRDYYRQPELMLKVQLEAARRRRELPIYDMVLGEAPERWPLSVDFFPVVMPGWVGCELVYRKDGQMGFKRLNLDRAACMEIDMPHVLEGGFLKTVAAFWEQMKALAEGLTYLGKPLGAVGHGVSSSGLFSLALSIRGEDLMLDMYEDPKLALTFLEEMAFWCDAIEQAWGERAGQAQVFRSFPISDHGVCMLSEEAYERYVLPMVRKHSKLRDMPLATELHYCGRGTHLFPTIHKAVGLTQIDGLTFPLVDVARVRRELGEEVSIVAAIDDAIIQEGPTERIRQTVKALLTPEVKGKGRFALMVGDMLKGTPLEHRQAYYEAVKEFGGY